MKLKHLWLLTLVLSTIGLVGIAQTPNRTNWRAVQPQTITLFSRTKYAEGNEGYGKSAFSFEHGLRSDAGTKLTRNDYDLEYGSIDFAGDRDWFGVTMVTDDRSRIKDLGALKWRDIVKVPLVAASPEPQKGVRFPAKTQTFEQSSNGQVTKVVAGHAYVIHTKDTDSDFYTLIRVEKLLPNDQVTISWKVVPSPEK